MKIICNICYQPIKTTETLLEHIKANHPEHFPADWSEPGDIDE